MTQVGGSSGRVGLLLASRFSELSFTVEDLPDTVASSSSAIAHIDQAIAPRIWFVAHDFFQPQPTGIALTANIYLLRKVLHDWTFNDARIILQHCAASLQPRARTVIMDTILLTSNTISKMQEAKLGVRDLTMAHFLTAKSGSLAIGWNYFRARRRGYD